MDDAIIRNAVAKHGSQRKAAKALGIHRSKVHRALQMGIADPTPTTKAPTGITLRDARISDHKPADNVKRLLYKLKMGMGFPIEHLAETWGISIENLRKQAKRFDCLKYVETEPGNWVLCALNPDTAEEFRKEAP